MRWSSKPLSRMRRSLLKLNQRQLTQALSVALLLSDFELEQRGASCDTQAVW